jgi:hypothetical protein
LPDADKLVSKNIALPAVEAVLWLGGGGGLV